MECFIVDPNDIDLQAGSLMLRGDESRHAARSLRMRVGESILATSLSGMCYIADIIEISDDRKDILVTATITDSMPEFNEPKLDVQLIQAILNQPSKFEEIAERCTEIGIGSLSPLLSERVERNNLKTDRIERVLRSACKQSYRSRKPQLLKASSFYEAFSRAEEEDRAIILLHETMDIKSSLRSKTAALGSRKIALVIGPEGGFTEEEVLLAVGRYKASIASLGARRLRAETAAITACAIALAESD